MHMISSPPEVPLTASELASMTIRDIRNFSPDDQIAVLRELARLPANPRKVPIKRQKLIRNCLRYPCATTLERIRRLTSLPASRVSPRQKAQTTSIHDLRPSPVNGSLRGGTESSSHRLVFTERQLQEAIQTDDVRTKLITIISDPKNHQLELAEILWEDPGYRPFRR